MEEVVREKEEEVGKMRKELEESGIALPIVSININYKKPARYDDLITVTTNFKSQSNVKVEFDCEIRNELGELLTTAHFILVFVDIKLGKAIAPPSHITALFKTV